MIRALMWVIVGVSILVFVELAFEAIAHDLAKGLSRMFQSLFLWNSPSKTNGPFHVVDDRLVSILVFVELAFEVRRGSR